MQVRQLAEQQSSAAQPDPSVQLHLEAEKEALSVQLAETQAALLGATQAQHAAEASAASLQQQVLQLQHSLQAAPTRGSPQLEQQVSELQELLYQKQQQLEQLSGERQAQMMMLERQVCAVMNPYRACDPLLQCVMKSTTVMPHTAGAVCCCLIGCFGGSCQSRIAGGIAECFQPK
jgi:chromosome segregation ATPase